jgi:hypothetical protein
MFLRSSADPGKARDDNNRDGPAKKESHADLRGTTRNSIEFSLTPDTRLVKIG